MGNKKIGQITSWIIRGLFLYAIIWTIRGQVNWNMVVGHIDGGALYWLFCAQPFLVGSFLLLGSRHAQLVREPRISYVIGFKSVLISGGLNMVLPGRLAELVKVTYIREHAGIKFGEGLAAVVTERIMDVFALLLLAFVFLSQGNPSGLYLLTPAFLGILLILIIGHRYGSVFERLATRIPSQRIQKLVISIIQRYVNINKLRRTPAIWMMTLSAWILSWLGIHTIVTGMYSQPLLLYESGLVYLAATIGFAIPLFPAGLGTYESAVVLAMTNLGAPVSEAVATALVLRLYQVVLIIPATLIVLLLEPVGLMNLIRDTRKPPDG